ncbi:MAG: hypothetical protein FWE48_01890 [Coriobacteriia bacterium]|nr:hypothetical protein [Coriobacteriia bacterium]MCL2870548.1 hypothetical protein [Coriobacteriia bacterium]
MLKQSKIAVTVVLGIALLTFISLVVVLPAQTFASEGEAESGIEATSTGADNLEITDFEAMTVIIRRLPNTYFAAVTGFLNPEVQLPATVEIALPEGSHIIWFGEPSEAGPIEADPRFEDPDMRNEDGFDIYTVTLENEHHVQVEYNLFFSPATEAGDGSYILRMEYTPLTDLQAIRFKTNLPIGSEVLDDDVEFYGMNSEGERQYGRTFRDTTAGRMITTNLTYTSPRFQGTPNESRVSDGLVVTVVVMLVGVAGALGIVVIAKKRRTANADNTDK